MRRKDRELWDAVRAGVTPLRGNPSPPPVPPATALPVERPPPAPPPDPRRPPPPARPEATPGNSLDRRTRQRLLRGKADIEDRLDLHGDGIEIAYMRLRGFLNASRARGLRLVLVITGKGSGDYARHTLHGTTHWDAPEREGRLRRLLPQWLAEPELSAMVVAFQPAHPRHGGGGAWYVRLRRKRIANSE
ncbi:MAG: Smr/MutS family protein [Aestuariivirgaceae bacterium]